MLYSSAMLDVRVEPDAVTRLVRALRAWGLNGLAAALLESGGPLTFLGAQALYFGAPFLEPFGAEGDLHALAQLLEDPAAVHALAGRLAEKA